MLIITIGQKTFGIHCHLQDREARFQRQFHDGRPIKYFGNVINT